VLVHNSGAGRRAVALVVTGDQPAPLRCHTCCRSPWCATPRGSRPAVRSRVSPVIVDAVPAVGTPRRWWRSRVGCAWQPVASRSRADCFAVDAALAPVNVSVSMSRRPRALSSDGCRRASRRVLDTRYPAAASRSPFHPTQVGRLGLGDRVRCLPRLGDHLVVATPRSRYGRPDPWFAVVAVPGCGSG